MPDPTDANAPDPTHNPAHAALHGAFEAGGDFAHTCLGYRLRAMTLWHLRALHLIKHPLAYSAREGRMDGESFESLFFAVQVARMAPGGRVGDRLKRMADGAGEGTLGAARQQVAFALFAKDPEAQFSLFAGWWGDHFSIPTFGKREGAQTLRTQTWLVLQTYLMLKLGYSREEAEMESPGRAVWLMTCARELEREDPPIHSEEDIAALREAGWAV